MEQLTTYRAKGKKIGLVLLFKYDLYGNLKVFEVSECELNPDQIAWLFSPNFPAHEITLVNEWLKKEKFQNVFEINKSPADLSFEAAWIQYDLKFAKQDAQKAFKKMSEAEKILFFISLPYYFAYLKKSGIGKAHMSRYINGRYYENEYPEIVGKKNYNPVLADLAKQKTNK